MFQGRERQISSYEPALRKICFQSRTGLRTFNASYTELFSTIIYGFQSLSNVLKHKEPHLRYGREYFLLSVLSFEKASYYTLI